jgi:hypothetical protein
MEQFSSGFESYLKSSRDSWVSDIRHFKKPWELVVERYCEGIVVALISSATTVTHFD